MNDADIIIVGTGLVGASMACALADSSRSIILLDAKPYTEFSADTQTRPISLSYKSHLLLKQWGVWDRLAAHVTPILQVHVSEKNRFGATRITATTCDVPALGFVVDLALLHNALRTRVLQCKNITVQDARPITHVHDTADGVTIHTHTGELKTALLIAADGQESLIRKQLHIDFHHAPDSDAIITRVKAQHHNIAYERFTKNGVLAFLPMPHDECGVVWCARDAQHLMTMSDTEFLAQLQQTMGYRLGALTQLAPRQKITLKTGYALEQVRSSIVLLGNAAHTLHPVAAQGFNLSLRDIETLQSVITHQQSLQHYLRLQKKYQDRIRFATDSLLGIFTQPCFTVPRQWGLIALDACKPLQRAFARHAMGLEAC